MKAIEPQTNPPSRESLADGPTTSSSTVEVIKVLEERLNVMKQVVESGGGLRLRKLVHADLVDVREPLALDTLDVKRVSINREVDGPVPIRYEGDATVFPILEERLVTRKQLVLVEEVHVKKVRQVDRATEQVALRREEIVVERQDPASGQWSVIDAEVTPAER